MKSIDINCDLGEGIGNEALLMPYISSCNIACGGHAGDEDTMIAVVDLAQKHNVKIGAHPSFPDKANFGRQVLNMSPSELYKTIYSQIARLNFILKEKGLLLHHVKPHGALYNLATVNKKAALVIVKVVKSFDMKLSLYVPFQSMISEIAKKHDVPIKYEVFIDRNYNEDLTLVSRNHDNALISDPKDMFEHVYRMINHGKVTTVNGVGKMIKADTFCVHGDGKNVVENLKFLTQKLRQNNITIL